MIGYDTAWCKPSHLASRWDWLSRCNAPLTEELWLWDSSPWDVPSSRPELVALQCFNPISGVIKVTLLSYLQPSVIFFPFPSYFLLNLFQGEIHHGVGDLWHSSNNTTGVTNERRIYDWSSRSIKYSIFQVKCILIPRWVIIILGFLHLCQEMILKAGAALWPKRMAGYLISIQAH